MPPKKAETQTPDAAGQPKTKRVIHAMLPWAFSVLIIGISMAVLLFGQVIIAVTAWGQQLQQVPGQAVNQTAYVAVAGWFYILATLLLAVIYPLRRAWVTYAFWVWAASGFLRLATIAHVLNWKNVEAIGKVSMLWLSCFSVVGLGILLANRAASRRRRSLS